MMSDQRIVVTVDDSVISEDGSDVMKASSGDKAPSVVLGTGAIRTPFLHSDFITADPIIFRDELTRAQSVAAGAAILASEHTVGLLYASDVDAHQAPYGAVPVHNSLDAHNWIIGNNWRHSASR